MDISGIRGLLVRLSEGSLSVESTLEEIKQYSFEDISIARIDHKRHLRNGIPEVIFGLNKDDDDIIKIARAMHRENGKFLITRTTETVFNKLNIEGAIFHKRSGLITCGGADTQRGSILVISAGTSDMAAAEEAALTASFLGNRVETIFDVGVAGIHRLFSCIDKINSARVVIVVAGMEGALPSVAGGLTDKPVIAVPTSSGYGSSLGGITALFAMLNSCVPGIAVMNIDNGFGAACLAHRINSLND